MSHLGIFQHVRVILQYSLPLDHPVATARYTNVRDGLQIQENVQDTFKEVLILNNSSYMLER